MSTHLSNHFATFRNHVVGIDQYFTTPYGEKKIIYADWTASGRLYGPIERRISDQLGPFVGNTHTETTVTGCSMTLAYHKALDLIKHHLNADEKDVILTSESGMTGVINKFQRILGFRVHERYKMHINIPKKERPVVFVTHMEHHSNHTSWLETIADVECIAANEEGLVDLNDLNRLLYAYQDRKVKIAAVTACSNVTGVTTPYHEIAKQMHIHRGLCFVDFACSAPYVEINMHPKDPLQKLDAVYFSPHKFLGGPGTPGVVVFDRGLYSNQTPDNPGGGTVYWTNPWGERSYIEDIEVREDGGTPAFLQTIKAAFAMQLKEEMGVENMLEREKEIMNALWEGLTPIPNLHILADNIRDRMGIISFYIDGLHFNLAARLLNDRFGIQVRGGCSCAGTYGHYLLQVSREKSNEILYRVAAGDLSVKPGWVRLSIHPIMTDEEVQFMIHAIQELAVSFQEWAEDYRYDPATNEYVHIKSEPFEAFLVDQWFSTAFNPENQALLHVDDLLESME